MYTLKRYYGFHTKKYTNGQIADMTVFQSYQIQKMYFSRAWIYGARSRSVPVTYVVYSDGKPVLLFPALEGKHSIVIAGSTNGICSLSPIYLGDTDAYEDALMFCLKKMPCKTIRIDRLFEDSRTARMLNSNIEWAEITSKTDENVRIKFENGYDAWQSTLKKSVRQNMRTAYNRCNTDGLSVRFELYYGGKISSEIMKNLVKIYNDRHAVRYGVKTSTLKRIYMEYFDFSTKSLKNNENARHGVLYLNDQIAGFFSGYYDAGTQSIVVPRLSIDLEFERYSPGYMLINETIRYYENDDDVVCLDLSKGVERYKTDLGGEVYLKGSYILTRLY